MKWAYVVEGKGRENADWSVKGEMEATPGQFPVTVQDVLRDSFIKLTEGRAEYGNQKSCQGPYRILRLVIELTEDLPPEAA